MKCCRQQTLRDQGPVASRRILRQIFGNISPSLAGDFMLWSLERKPYQKWLTPHKPCSIICLLKTATLAAGKLSEPWMCCWDFGFRWWFFLILLNRILFALSSELRLSVLCSFSTLSLLYEVKFLVAPSVHEKKYQQNSGVEMQHSSVIQYD